MKTHAQAIQAKDSSLGTKAKNQAHEGSILQAYKNGTSQLAEDKEPVQRQENKTGLPDNLKSGVENLSGHSLDDVKVHYNSSQPASLQAHAYAQGTDIHVAPGQEKHLPHEAWHVAQQKQGRVQPTKQLKGTTNINDDQGLEKEADVMGAKAMQMKEDSNPLQLQSKNLVSSTAQLEDASHGNTTVNWETGTLCGDKVGTKMEATKLEKSALSKHPNLKGSPPGSGQQSGLMSYLPTNPKLVTTEKFIKGHLLNHNVGGPGKDFNMYPITASANKAHLMGIETDVKNWVLGGHTVDYSVEVREHSNTLESVAPKSKKGSVKASFLCNASNGSDNISTEIPSEINVKSAPQEPTSLTEGFGSQGVFGCLYDYAVEEDDPNELIWKVAGFYAKELGADKDEMAEVFLSVVIFDDVTDLSEEASALLKKHGEYLVSHKFHFKKSL